MTKSQITYLATCIVVVFNAGLIAGNRLTYQRKEKVFSSANKSVPSAEVSSQLDMHSLLGKALLREDSRSQGTAMKLLGTQMQFELERIAKDSAGVWPLTDQTKINRSNGIKDDLLKRAEALAPETATDGLKIELEKNYFNPNMIELRFTNMSTKFAELEIPVEGTANCYDFFKIEAVAKDGSPIREPFMYAPGIPPYTVKLEPQGQYVHSIKPGAYVHVDEMVGLKMLRVSYTNKLTGVTTVSKWLTFQNKNPRESGPRD